MNMINNIRSRNRTFPRAPYYRKYKCTRSSALPPRSNALYRKGEGHEGRRPSCRNRVVVVVYWRHSASSPRADICFSRPLELGLALLELVPQACYLVELGNSHVLQHLEGSCRFDCQFAAVIHLGLVQQSPHRGCSCQ